MLPGSDHLHEEKRLLTLLRQGNRDAFDEIYQRHAGSLFGRAYQKTGIREIAEDLIQDVFTSLWIKKDQLEIRCSLGAYLQGILDHKIIDYYRKACTQLSHIDHLAKLLDQPDPSPLDKMTAKEQESVLQTSISSLSEKMRNIFILSRYEQLSTEEIARRLSLSSQTVRNQVSKALKILRVKMTTSAIPKPAPPEK